jgi:hypothetical protein
VTWWSVATVLRSDSPWLTALAATALVYLVLVGTAAPIGLGLVAEQAASPFVIAASLLSGLTVVVAWSILRRGGRVDRGEGAAAPRMRVSRPLVARR